MFEEGRDLRVPRSNGPKVQESQGPGVPRSKGLRYLKVTFKYKLDSKDSSSTYTYTTIGIKAERHDSERWRGFGDGWADAGTFAI